MKLCFLDLIPWDYDVGTPLQRPLGGSQSALCYLTAALARRGHEVILMCGTRNPREVLGVRCLDITRPVPSEVMNPQPDAVIVLNGPAGLCLNLRQFFPRPTPLVLWTQHAPDQQAMSDLVRPDVRAGWDAIACVSDWHRRSMIAAFGLEPGQVRVLRNAVAPVFEELFRVEADLVVAKSGPPVLAYTSTPFRGLDLLLDVFPQARREFPDLELHIYSSMKVYQQGEETDPFAPLYRRSRDLPGVRYAGSLAQPELAQSLRGASILAYPNTFAETSCIAVMEAMAAGLFVLTTDLGALSETTMGFGRLVPPAPDASGRAAFVESYLGHLRTVLDDRFRDPVRFAAERFPQVRAVRERLTWSARAAEWEEAVVGWRK